MIDQPLYSEKTAAQALSPGGYYDEKPALDITNHQHASIQINSKTRYVDIWIDGTTRVYVWVNINGAETTDANKVVLRFDQKYTMEIPLDIGSVIHYNFKQISSDPAGAVRFVER